MSWGKVLGDGSTDERSFDEAGRILVASSVGLLSSLVPRFINEIKVGIYGEIGLYGVFTLLNVL